MYSRNGDRICHLFEPSALSSKVLLSAEPHKFSISHLAKNLHFQNPGPSAGLLPLTGKKSWRGFKDNIQDLRPHFRSSYVRWAQSLPYGRRRTILVWADYMWR